MQDGGSKKKKIDSMENCFPAIAPVSAAILILGSFPGILSLKRQRYYAHPRNSFWPIMADLLTFSENLSYEDRLLKVVERKIALWDVLYCCRRMGSLDSAIEGDSVVVNDFRKFFTEQQKLKAIFFNGARAEMEFKKRVASADYFQEEGWKIECFRLPSTSPALASLKISEKREAWKIILDYL